MEDRARQTRLGEFVDGYLRQKGPLDAYLATVDAELREDVSLRCKEADFARGFLNTLPPLRLMPPLPTTIAGCELGELLGEGSMGQVLRARQHDLGRDIALKLMPANASDRSDFLGRFRDEAKVLASLDHPGIVRVLFCGEAAGWLYFGMDLVPGPSLAAQLPYLLQPLADRSQARRFDRGARIVAEILEALAYAHRQGIVHRDLKPSNVVLDAADHPRIVDFGLAKAVSTPTRTLPGQVIGTPAYLCPELVGARPCDRFQQDQWAIGVILFQLMTGRLPYDGKSTDELLQQLLRPVVQDARRVTPDVPRPLAAICARALAPNPIDRYSSAAAFAADLRRFLAGEPVDAGRRRLVRPVVLHLLRHRLAYATAIFVVAVGTIAWLGALSHARHQITTDRVDGLIASASVGNQDAKVLARHADDARRLLGNDDLQPEQREHLVGLLDRLNNEAKSRHAQACALVAQGAGSPVNTPLAEYRAPAPALLFRGLALVSEAALVQEGLPDATAVASSSFPVLRVETNDSGEPADVRIDAVDYVTGTSTLTLARGTTPFNASVPTGTYRVVLVRGNAFAELSIVVSAPGEHVLRPRLLATGQVVAGMIAVPAGNARIGMASELPTVFTPRTVSHQAFFIDRTEVTCAQYRAFVLATGETPPRTWGDQYDPAWDQLPVVGVTALASARYATWAGKRLPTWTEWQIAARGPLGFLYPWGDDPAPTSRAVFGQSPTTPWHQGVRPVGTTEADVSWCGALDMLGNVDEWTDSPYVALFEDQPFPVHPWRLCGGVAWNTRSTNPPTLDIIRPGQPEWFGTGFRCAKSTLP